MLGKLLLLLPDPLPLIRDVILLPDDAFTGPLQISHQLLHLTAQSLSLIDALRCCNPQCQTFTVTNV